MGGPGRVRRADGHRPTQPGRAQVRRRVAPDRDHNHSPATGRDPGARVWDIWDSGPQFGTPLYYRSHLDRFPERSAAVIAAIARCEPGGIAFHCVGGRDRTGQIAMLLLALVGVSPEDIASEYQLSTERLRARYVAHGEEDQGPMLEAFLAGQGTTAREVIISTLDALDVEAHLRAGGLTENDLAAVCARSLTPAGRGG